MFTTIANKTLQSQRKAQKYSICANAHKIIISGEQRNQYKIPQMYKNVEFGELLYSIAKVLELNQQ